MRKFIASLACLFVLGCFYLPACGGGGSKTYVQNDSKTKGQELLDLQKAYDSGALTEEEYQEVKKRIIKGKY